MNYWRHTETALGRWLPPNAKTVVEFGCESDRLQQGFTQVAPQASYFREERALQWEKESETMTADCLVYGAAWFFQEGLLQRMEAHLRRCGEAGQALFLIPYAGYWRVWQEMLQTGSVSSYPKIPLEQVQELLAHAGWHCQDVQLLQPDEGQATRERDKFFNSVHTAAAPEALRKAQGIAFLVRACRRKPESWFLQALLGESVPICARVRVVDPQSFCATIPGVRIQNDHLQADMRAGRPMEKKVFFWQRTSPQNLEALNKLFHQEYLIVAEIDDDPAHWQSTYVDNDYLIFRASHAVQVSTEPLSALLRQYNPHVAVFENQITVLPPLRLTSPERRPLKLFFGALNRENDWRPYIDTLNRVLAAYEEEVCAVVVHDRRFFEALNLKNKEFKSFLPYNTYCEELYRADISFLFLEDNRFNRLKSDLKFLECAAHGVAILASPVVYARSVQEGKTGALFSSPAEFAVKLERMLKDDCYRETLIRGAYEWVKTQRMLSQHYEKRFAWYKMLYENYRELTVEALERIKFHKLG